MKKSTMVIALATLTTCAAAVFATPGAGVVHAAEELYVNINERNFPDKTFREHVKTYDKDKDGNLSTSETNAVKSIDLSGSNLTDLTGIHFFDQLETLYLLNCPITTLDLRECTQLRTLQCSRCKLTSLNVTGLTKLNTLECDNNNLTSIDLTTNTNLGKLIINNNNLSSLNLKKNTNLSYLYISDNELSSLDLTRCTKLSTLWFSAKTNSNNKLSSIDLSKCANLYDLVLENHNLTTLDFSSNLELTRLAVSNNGLTSLEISKNTKLKELYCSKNNLTTLVVTQCPDLENLQCENNKISSLNVTKCPLLKQLFCANNAIKTLNVTKCTKLERLSCSDNKIGALDVTKCPSLLLLLCEGNALEALDLTSCTKLYRVLCGKNKIPSLDVSKCPLLEYLHCFTNELKTLDVSQNPVLRELYCYENYLTSLKLKGAADLRQLTCQGNNLTSLDVSNNKKLYVLSCFGNPIKTLNLNSTPDLNACMSKMAYKVNMTYHGKDCTGLRYGIDTYQFVIVDISTKVISSNLTPTPTPTPIPAGVIHIDETHFPDANFRKEVASQADRNNDGYLDLQEKPSCTSIYCNESKITSLKGIEYLTGLKYLYCSKNALTSVDLSKNTELLFVDLSGNQLTGLDLRKNTKLQEVHCNSNQISSLNLSACPSLNILFCNSNPLTSLNLSKNPQLRTLRCDDTGISTLKIFYCPDLVNVYTHGYKIDEDTIVEYFYLDNLNCYLGIPPTAKIIATVGKPSGVTAETVSAAKVNVSWNAVSGATGYQVWRGTSATGSFTALGSVTETSRASVGLTANTTYYYKVRAYIMVNGTKYYGAYSTVVSATTKVAAPAGVKAATSSVSKIEVSWNAVNGATGYQVWRGTSATGSFTALGSVTTTSRVSTGLSAGTTYYYKVRAYKEVDGARQYGNFSSVISGVTKPSAPGGVKTAAASATKVNVSWNAVTGATGYEVWRSESSGGSYVKLGAVTTTSRACPGLTTGKTYYFKVRAYIEVNGTKIYGAYSTAASATPKK